MDSLYALTINGNMLFLNGNLSEKDYLEIDRIAKQFQANSGNSKNYKDTVQDFITTIQQTLNVTLSEIPLKYVFRIK